MSELKRSHDELEAGSPSTEQLAKEILGPELHNKIVSNSEEDNIRFLNQCFLTSKIPLDTYKRRRLEVQPLSGATWEQITRAAPGYESIDDIEDTAEPLPIYPLPSDELAKIYVMFWELQDIYGVVAPPNLFSPSEASLVHVSEAFVHPILSLFGGKVFDRPEQAMEATPFFSSGQVEHELWVVGGAFFLVVELKSKIADGNLPQLLAEMLVVAQHNLKLEWHSQVPIYGLLTDLQSSRFYRLTPAQNPANHLFERMKRMYVTGESRTDYTRLMTSFAITFFSFVLDGYAQSIRASLKRSQSRIDSTSVSSSQSLVQEHTSQTPKDASGNEQPVDRKTKGRKSIDDWGLAVEKVDEAIDLFAKASRAVSVDEMDDFARDALKRLVESVNHVPLSKKKEATPWDTITREQVIKNSLPEVKYQLEQWLKVDGKAVGIGSRLLPVIPKFTS